MITFGFKSKFSGWIRAIAAIILGILIISSRHPEAALPLVVRVLAAFLVAAGVVTLVYGIINRNRGMFGLLTASSVIDIVLGIVIFCIPEVIAGIMLLLIGIALLVFGFWEIVVLASVVRVTNIGFGSFILPIVCVLSGLFVVLHPVRSLATLTVIAGIALIVYGVSEGLATWRMNRAMKARNMNAASAGAKTDVSEAKEAEYEKVEEE